MLPISKTLMYYKREDIRKAIVEGAKDKEIVARFNDKFGKRPDTLQYPNDVLELAKQRATSFHASEELWRNPLAPDPGNECIIVITNCGDLVPSVPIEITSSYVMVDGWIGIDLPSMIYGIPEMEDVLGSQEIIEDHACHRALIMIVSNHGHLINAVTIEIPRCQTA